MWNLDRDAKPSPRRRVSLGRLAALVLALAALALPGAVRAAGTLDQQNATWKGGSVAVKPGSTFAQVFTAGITGTLDGVDLYASGFNSTSALHVEIRSVSGGRPTGTVLGSSYIAQNFGLTWMSMRFDVDVQAGTQYAIVAAVDVKPGAFWSWGTARDAYAGGSVFSYDGFRWSPFNVHLMFKTYVTPGTDRKIAFARQEPDGNYEVYVMDADGSGQTNLTSHPAFDVGPSWSPDGTRLAFMSDRDGNEEIYVMNADGSGQTNLTTNAAFDFDPSWSPDGTRIAFASFRDGNAEIYMMNADGSGQTRLTSNAAFDFDPSWSPDGTGIAFTSDRDGRYEVYVMNADGSGQTNLTTNPAFDLEPNWSPDGTRIAFTSTRDGNAEVYVMNADGSGQTRLTTVAGSDGEPSWSPDGTRIAFRSSRDGNDEVYVMNADGSGQTRLTTNAESDLGPSWQPLPAADTTAPEIDYALDPDVPDGDDGWYRSAVALTWSVVEPESPASLVTTGCENRSITTDRPATGYTCAATSDGGTAGPVEVRIKRDATPPAVAVTGVSDGAQYVLGAVPAAGCSTSDATSGVRTAAAVSVTGGPVGTVIASCSGAVDNAGNTAPPASVTYQVVPAPADPAPVEPAPANPPPVAPAPANPAPVAPAPANTAPVARDDAYSTREDTPLAVAAPGVLRDDRDAQGDPLTAALVRRPRHGSLTLRASGAFTYRPAPNFFGTDSFAYRASDAALRSRVATVRIRVSAVADPRCRGRLATLVGTGGPDVLRGTPRADVIVARGGNDSIRGRGGNDLVCAGPGADDVRGGGGHDRVFGGPGNDRLLDASGADTLRGQTGSDHISGGAGADRLEGNAGDDTLRGGTGDDRLLGATGNDRLEGDTGEDALRGGVGDDRLLGAAGNDFLDGGDGRDMLLGGNGNDRLFGGPAVDFSRGGPGIDRLVGGTGEDNGIA